MGYLEEGDVVPRSPVDFLLARLSSPRGYRSRPAVIDGHLARGARLGAQFPNNQVMPLAITSEGRPCVGQIVVPANSKIAELNQS
jgi:hypothetical protein